MKAVDLEIDDTFCQGIRIADVAAVAYLDACISLYRTSCQALCVADLANFAHPYIAYQEMPL